MRDGVTVGRGVHIRADRDDVITADKEGERVVGLPHVLHQRRVPLFDVDERVELVEFVGVLSGGVVDIEVRYLDVLVGPLGLGQGVTSENLAALAVLCAAGVLQLTRGGAECLRRLSAHADAETRRHRIPVSKRVLDELVGVAVQPVRDGHHVVEPAEEGVPLPVADKL